MGCASAGGGTDVTALASSLPQVKDFLAQYPNATISVTLWSNATVAQDIASIRSACGDQFPISSYYKISVVDPSFTLIAWLDAGTQQVVCAFRVPTSASAASNATAQPYSETPPLPPGAGSQTSPGLPPLPPGETTQPTGVATEPVGVPPLPPVPSLMPVSTKESACIQAGGSWNPCASPCKNAPPGTACPDYCIAECEYPSQNLSVPQPAQPIVGGPCAYASFNGTCEIAGSDSTSVQFSFTPDNASDIAAQAAFVPNFTVIQDEPLNFFVSSAGGRSWRSTARTRATSASRPTAPARP